MAEGMNRRRSWIARLRPLTVAVFLLIVLATLLTASRIDGIADQQNGRLLAEQSAEAAVVLESALHDIEVSFPNLAGALRLAPDELTAFEPAAESLVGGTVLGVGLAEAAGEGPQVAALVGDGPPVGAPLGSSWLALVARAQSEEGLVSGVLPAAGSSATTVGFAYPFEAGSALFMTVRFDPSQLVEIEDGSPFSDLSGALYAGPEADPAHLVLATTSELPLTGDVVHERVQVGGDEWLLVTRAKRPLVGSLARQTLIGVLVGGVVLAVLTALLVEILGQRRAYALRLVDERTAELSRARQAAEEANHSKSEFLSRMSHELRTPLNAVLGFGQLLEMEDLEPDQQDSVKQILKGGRHLLDLINEVLDISRIEAGELSLSPEAVQVEELVHEVVDLIRPLADQTGIQVVVDRSGVCDCYVFADRQRSKQVLLNLLSNAVKYNRSRGTVAVSCERPTETMARITVTDTGPGIPADRIGRLFTAFERLGAEQTAVEGTGIGLALSQRLAGAMDGRLGVDSTVGRGSTFYVDLPRVEGPVHRYERLNGGSAVAEEKVPVDRSHVVLHIEDNLSNLKLVERIFATRPDVHVVGAMHGSLGLELAREHLPALVLLDLHLPDMGGEQVLQRLRDDPVTASIPVAIVSADATPGQVQRLLSAGASAYLTKPIEVRELVGVLDQALTGRS